MYIDIYFTVNTTSLTMGLAIGIIVVLLAAIFGAKYYRQHRFEADVLISILIIDPNQLQTAKLGGSRVSTGNNCLT